VALNITPEMCGKVIDESHYDFHVTCKAKIINAVNKIKEGGDLLKTLSHLNFKTDPKWLANTCGDPSVKALLEILEEYKKNEHRPTRAKILVPLIEYAIGLYASDLFFRERGSWFITQIIKRQNEFGVCFIPQFADPKGWYPLTRNLTPPAPGVVPTPTNYGINYYDIEQDPNVQCVEDDYKEWYGVDVNADTIEIDPEKRAKTIKDGQEYMIAELERMKVMVK
jgi:hypothetical protein